MMVAWRDEGEFRTGNVRTVLIATTPASPASSNRHSSPPTHLFHPNQISGRWYAHVYLVRG